MTRTKHGSWRNPQGGGRHDGYCNMSGAHVTYECGVRHAYLDSPCPAVRVTCPERGAHIIERGDRLTDDEHVSASLR